MKRSTEILILAVILSIFLVLYNRHSEKLKNTNVANGEVATEVNEKIRVLREQKQALQQQLDDAKQDLVVPNMGTTIILISETNKQCLTDIVPTLDEYNYVGVIAIDNKYSPLDNIDGYLNINDIDNLVKKGYEIVLKVNVDDNVQELYELYSKYFDVIGFYYPGAGITRAQVDYYKQIGINNVIIYGGEIQDNSIFSISAFGSYDNNARNNFDEGNKQSKTMAFTVGYSLDWDKYTEANFTAMIDKMDQAKQNNLTEIGNITKAVERYEVYQNYLQSDEYKQKQAKVSDIQTQIEEINNQLNTK